MKKNKPTFFCKNCGTESPKWLGKCPSCNEWNTFVEEVATPKNKQSVGIDLIPSKPLKIDEIQEKSTIRILCKDKEFNQVLGGGFVQGSLVLLGGEPGIGKSTFAMQIALGLNLKVVYVSGEENSKQIKLRCQRIGEINENCWIFNETNLENILYHLNKLNPEFIIIDSIQTIYTEVLDTSPGNISQIRECAGRLLKYAKANDKTLMLIGHITKDGQIAGPKVLEHIVDVVLYLEGDEKRLFRIIRATKNRFGATSEISMYQMKTNGLRAVTDISSILLSNKETVVSGITLAAVMEGKRTFMIEIQSLVSSTMYGNPQRATSGIHFKRLNMLLAVIENRLGYKLGAKDVFLNIAGGINVNDIAIDMAIIVAIISSYLNIIVSNKLCFVGEISLSGDVKPCSHINLRIKEAHKNGVKKIFVPSLSEVSPYLKNKIEIIKIEKLKNIIKHLVKS